MQKKLAIRLSWLDSKQSDEIRGNWLHFAHSNKATFQEQDFTDAEFEQVISNVSSEMLSSLNKVAT